MKTVGIIGGLSPESTVLYYQGINEGVRRKLGGHHNAKIILNSLDFGEFVALKNAGDWDTQAKILCSAARSLEAAGADFIVLATNTMHKMADQIMQSISIPFLHLADATAQRIKVEEIERVGLLGTRYTMEEDFYKARLIAQGIDVRVPDQAARDDVHRIIYDELCHGLVREESRQIYKRVILNLIQQGVQGIVLGCTEIVMLLRGEEVGVPLFDTTQIHIDAAVSKVFE